MSEILADALPLGELHLQVLVIEEEGRLTDLTFQLPVEPLHHRFGVVASMLLVIGAAMAILRVVLLQFVFELSGHSSVPHLQRLSALP